jgi:hypothetical protein
MKNETTNLSDLRHMIDMSLVMTLAKDLAIAKDRPFGECLTEVAVGQLSLRGVSRSAAVSYLGQCPEGQLTRKSSRTQRRSG